MLITDVLTATPVASLDLTRHVSVPPGATVADTVDTMAEAGRSCAVVVDARRPVGIFTQRDYLERVVGRPDTWERPIGLEMSIPVRTMPSTASIGDGLAIMNDWWVRSVPVLDDEGRLEGCLSFYALMSALASMLAERVSGHAGEPTIRDGLSLIDFTGINLSAPVVMETGDSVERAVQHMRVRGFGSVLVVDDRERLVGELSEFDLLTELGCAPNELADLRIGDLMDHDPRALEARSHVVDVIQRILDRESSHVPLTGESGRPVGLASVRDVVAFVETALEVLD